MTTVTISDGLQYTDAATDGQANEIVSSANASSSVNDGVGGSHFHLTITDSAGASSSMLGGGAEADLGASANASSTLGFRRTVKITSHAAAAGTPSTKNSTEATATESAAAVALATPVIVAVVAEAPDATATLTPSRVMSLVSHGAASAIQSASKRTVTAVINSNAGTDDSVGAPAVGTVEEVSDATDTVTGKRRVVVQINDTAGSSASDASKATAIMAFESSANAVAFAQYHTIAQQVVLDSADAFEFIKLPASSIPNFWTNTATTAGATWSGLPFNSIIAADGKLYGAGEDGLFTIENGIDDIDTPIDSRMTWDLLDFGSNNRKRIHAVYASASARGPFTIRVTNEQGTFDYETPMPRTFAPINHRAQPGKGLRAVYNRISLLFSADAGVNLTAVDYEEIGRKI